MKKSKAKFAIILVTIFIVFVMVSSNYNYCYCTNTTDDMISQGTDFISAGQNGMSNLTGQTASEFESSLVSKIAPFGGVLVGIATVVIVIVTAIMGIKWITASPEQQAKLKQQLIGLVIAIVVIYGAVGIWVLVKNIMEGLGI